jgi:hypothetical protein
MNNLVALYEAVGGGLFPGYLCDLSLAATRVLLILSPSPSETGRLT